ncbi:MAG: TonB-dependent receptor [Treponema sp.]|nr:TonB-dependent receptor [Treponema sp.]
MSFSRFLSLVLLTVVLLCPLWAQDANSNDNADGEGERYLDLGAAGGLVITASRTPEPAAVVPAHVTVITAEQIAASGAASVTDVLAQVPGVRFQGAQAGAGSEIVSMRGFGENSQGRVLVLLDGNRLNRPDMGKTNWGTIPLTDIERIEIVDGSASVQYGNHAVGGVINIITKRSGQRRTVLSASGGSFFSHAQSFSHFEPAPWGNFSLSAEYSGTEGYRQRQDSRVSHVSPRAAFFLRDNLTLSLSGFFSSLNYQLPGALTKEEFKDNPRQVQATNQNNENRERHYGGGVGLQWFPVKNVELNLPLSYREQIIDADFASFSSFSSRNVRTAEARPQGAVTFDLAGMPLRILGGVDLSLAHLDGDDFKDTARKDKNFSFTFTHQTLGAYVTARFSPLPMLTLTAGGRFDIAQSGGKNPTVEIDDSKTFRNFVYEGGIIFSPIQNFRFYAKYATLFRYPFVDELASIQGGSGGQFNTELNPETGFNTEGGVAYNVGKILAINANVFFMALQDEIAYVGTFGVDGRNKNIGQTQRIGTNVGLSLAPVKFLSVDASYSFVSAVFTAGENKDKSIPLIPAHKLYGALAVKLPFGLEFGPDVEFASESYQGGDFGNEVDTVDSWYVLGARARYVVTTNDRREFSLQVTGKNLLDRNFAKTGFTSQYGPDSVYPENGRSITVSSQFRF